MNKRLCPACKGKICEFCGGCKDCGECGCSPAPSLLQQAARIAELEAALEKAGVAIDAVWFKKTVVLSGDAWNKMDEARTEISALLKGNSS